MKNYDNSEILGELIGAFNQSEKITDARLKVFMKAVNEFPPQVIEHVRDSVIENCKFLPIPGDLKRMATEEMARIIAQQASKVATRKGEDFCSLCDGTQLVPGIWTSKSSGVWIHGVIGKCCCVAPYSEEFKKDKRYQMLEEIAQEYNTSPWGAIVQLPPGSDLGELLNRINSSKWS